MTSLTLRVPAKLKLQLARAGRRRKRSQSALVREAIAGYLRAERAPVPVRPVGFFRFDDELTPLANRATVSFTPPDEN
jgi:Ribbon-helix-helix protein, copG family